MCMYLCAKEIIQKRNHFEVDSSVERCYAIWWQMHIIHATVDGGWTYNENILNASFFNPFTLTAFPSLLGSEISLLDRN